MSQREKETARERSGLVSWPGQLLDGEITEPDSGSAPTLY